MLHAANKSIWRYVHWLPPNRMCPGQQATDALYSRLSAEIPAAAVNSLTTAKGNAEIPRAIVHYLRTVMANARLRISTRITTDRHRQNSTAVDFGTDLS